MFRRRLRSSENFELSVNPIHGKQCTIPECILVWRQGVRRF
ncbi:hypothetical protein [Neisseria sicca]|nr:hypothetical protein [Neisseria sicca]